MAFEIGDREKKDVFAILGESRIDLTQASPGIFAFRLFRDQHASLSRKRL